MIDFNIDKVRTFVRRSGLFSTGARVMADFALRHAPGASGLFYLTVALTVQNVQNSHVCYKLSLQAGTVLAAVNEDCPCRKLHLPDVESWKNTLLEDPACRHLIALAPLDDIKTVLLVLDGADGCYLQRQYYYEQSIVKALIRRARIIRELPQLPENFLHDLVTFFPDKAKHPAPDFQQLAVLAALRHKLMVLSGGPGTGKTTVAGAILALELMQNPDLKIKLAAPTAKAASRLQSSLVGNIDHLHGVSERVITALRELEAGTVHHLLGVKRDSTEFKHNAENPLDCDLLMVDECSMVPQHLMARLLEALPENAGLILLGDRYQLASVEAGSVIGDICQAARPNVLDAETAALFEAQTQWQIPQVNVEESAEYPLSACLVELTENHRFDKSAPGIGECARWVREMTQQDNVFEIAGKIAAIQGGGFEFVDAQKVDLEKFVREKLKQPRLASSESMLDLPALAAAGTPEERQKAFALLNSLKFLAPAYQGPSGIDKINEICMKALHLGELHSVGVPIIIRENNYKLDLCNSDIGLICLNENKEIRIYFPDKERAYRLAELPDHAPVFAMSVHKSQGSGFGETVCVMPEKFSELCTREMIYTAMTRAEKHLCCLGTTGMLAQTLANETIRMSNLTIRLREAAAGACAPTLPAPQEAELPDNNTASAQ